MSSINKDTKQGSKTVDDLNTQSSQPHQNDNSGKKDENNQNDIISDNFTNNASEKNNTNTQNNQPNQSDNSDKNDSDKILDILSDIRKQIESQSDNISKLENKFDDKISQLEN